MNICNVYINVSTSLIGTCDVEVFYHDPVCDEWDIDEDLTKKNLNSRTEADLYINELWQQDDITIRIQDVRYF
jgi:hypothetical protein